MIAKWYNLNPKTKGKILGNAIGMVIIGLIVYGIYFFASTQKAEEIVHKGRSSSKAKDTIKAVLFTHLPADANNQKATPKEAAN